MANEFIDNLENSKKLLTKKLIIEEYLKSNIDNYTDLSEFKLITLLIDIFPNITISKDFPSDLLLDNFDLMLEVFADWNYDSMSENDIENIINLFKYSTKNNIDKFHMQDIMFAITTYAPKNFLKKLTQIIKTQPELLFLLDEF